MRYAEPMKAALLVVVALAAAAAVGQQPAPSAAGKGVEMVVTALPSQPAISASQVAVRQGRDTDRVLGWQPCAGDNAALELAIVIDDDTHGLHAAFDDLKSFVNGLPPTTSVAIVYLHTGTIGIEQILTTDHAAAVQHMRLPNGGDNASPSPYGSLQVLLSRWGRHPGRRREMILLSDGEEHNGGNNANNITFKEAVAAAVRDGVVVYPIFVSGAPANSMDSQDQGTPMGKGGNKFAALNSSAIQRDNGLLNLSFLARTTGGEAYSDGNATPPRLQGYLEQINQRLNAQYTLTYAPSAPKNNGLNDIKVEVKDSKAKISAPDQVYLVKP